MECYIRGPGWFSTELVGESAHQQSLEAICGGRNPYGANYRTQAQLILDNADGVRVEISGVEVGRLAGAHASGYRSQLARASCPDACPMCDAIIIGGWDRGGGDLGKFGVNVDLPPIECDLELIEGPPRWPDGSLKRPR